MHNMKNCLESNNVYSTFYIHNIYIFFIMYIQILLHKFTINYGKISKVGQKYISLSTNCLCLT